MIVADTNLLAYLYIPGEHTNQAEAVLVRDPIWAAPLLWRSELRNLLSGLARAGAISLDVALQVMREVEGWMSGREYTVLSHQVLQLAAQSRSSAYDCEFVALAQDLGVPLITNDRQILEAFPATAVALDAFVA